MTFDPNELEQHTRRLREFTAFDKFSDGESWSVSLNCTLYFPVRAVAVDS